MYFLINLIHWYPTLPYFIRHCNQFIRMMRNLNCFPRILCFPKAFFIPQCNFAKPRSSLPVTSFISTHKTSRFLVNRLALIQGGPLYTTQSYSLVKLQNISLFRQNVNFKRYASTKPSEQTKILSRSVMYYVLSLVIFMLGVAYAGAPLYRIFCQVRFLISSIGRIYYC